MKLLDTGIRLSLPYNQDEGYPEWLETRAEGVDEVYLPIHRSAASTGRTWTGPRDAESYAARLRLLAPVLVRHGVVANLIVNGAIMGVQRPLVLREVERMRAVFGDAMRLTVTDYDLARELRRAFADLELGVSTLANVASESSARLWVEGVGVRFIVPSREVNRRPTVLRAIRDLGVKLRVVVDDTCVPGCPAAMAHFIVCFDGGPRTAKWCAMQEERLARPWLVAQKDIVPGALPHYAGLIDSAKLQGRSHSLEAIDHARRLYLAASSFEHPYGLYTEPPDADARITTCDRVCSRCGWCERNFGPG